MFYVLLATSGGRYKFKKWFEICILQNLNVNVISLISSDRTNNFLQNGVLHFRIRCLAVDISQLS